MGLAYSGYSRICRNATPCLGYWHKRSNTPALLGPSSVSMLTTALQMSTNALLWSKVMHYLVTLSCVVQCYAISYFTLYILPFNLAFNLKLLAAKHLIEYEAAETNIWQVVCLSSLQCTCSEKICLFWKEEWKSHHEYSLLHLRWQHAHIKVTSFKQTQQIAFIWSGEVALDMCSRVARHFWPHSIHQGY